MVADSKSAFIDQTVVPGDVVLDLSSMSNHTIKLGQGLRQDGDVISVMKAGKLRFSKPNKYWVESSNKRYVPCVEDTVLGIVVDQKADNFLVDIKGPTLAFLPVLAFEGGSRRNKPKFEEARRQKEGKKARIKKLDDWRDIHPQWCDRKPKKKERERKYKSQTLKVMGDVEVQCGEEKKLVEKRRNTGRGSGKELGTRLVLQSEVEEEGDEITLNTDGAVAVQGCFFYCFRSVGVGLVPKRQVGKLLYVRVVKANADMNPELSCTDVNGKAAEFGPLKDGYMFESSTGLSRMLLSSPTCPVLEALGKKLSFEIAVGLNGRVWLSFDVASCDTLCSHDEMMLCISSHVSECRISIHSDPCIKCNHDLGVFDWGTTKNYGGETHAESSIMLLIGIVGIFTIGAEIFGKRGERGVAQSPVSISVLLHWMNVLLITPISVIVEELQVWEFYRYCKVKLYRCQNANDVEEWIKDMVLPVAANSL
ncbi:hypothetical protein IFM89_038083 [Coptis chinensis]|uniref:Ribosomal RNA-processing protein 40 n=1 Tax=Coptis chinensis TaxID=261450 RepID=A0A835I7N9_9MAGN|nr:hypothetical protein IFM89_038083 [Coptis chinensis]